MKKAGLFRGAEEAKNGESWACPRGGRSEGWGKLALFRRAEEAKDVELQGRNAS